MTAPSRSGSGKAVIIPTMAITIAEGFMEPKNAAKRAPERDDRAGDEGDSLELESAGATPGDPDEEAGVTGEIDLDEIDVPLDPDFPVAEVWEFEGMGVDDDEGNDDDEVVDDEFDDEAEMQLLHELGIDLDAPDGEVGLDFQLEIAQEDPADDGVAA